MIGVGGLYANLFAYYFNDFTGAFFGLWEFMSYARWQGKIMAASCWNVSSDHVVHGGKAYASDGKLGYAAITTYKDINGTVGFLIWGYDARDAYARA
jgi:hypothetical protein